MPKKAVKSDGLKKISEPEAPLIIESTESTVSEVPSGLSSKNKLLPRVRFKKYMFVYFIVLVLVGGVGASAVYYYNQYKSAQKILNSKTQLNPKETEMLVSKVGELMILPTDEIPMIATISNKDQLLKADNVNTAFFKNSANGDKILVYKKASKAIIYRPSTNKLVEVGPVNIQQQKTSPNVAGIETTASDSASSLQADSASSLQADSASSLQADRAKIEKITPTPSITSITVTILNGTKTSGLAKKAETELTSPQLKFVTRGNAVRDQEKTIVVDLTGKQSSAAQTIAKRLGATVSKTVPDGEAASTSDILIILGQDYVK